MTDGDLAVRISRGLHAMALCLLNMPTVREATQSEGLAHNVQLDKGIRPMNQIDYRLPDRPPQHQDQILQP